VTSASLMVRWPAVAEAAAYARAHPGLSVGLHLDLGEWAYRRGEWVKTYEVVPENDAEAVAAEVAHQLAAFRQLVGRDPTHLDSHQHVHKHEPLHSLMADLAGQLGVPLRSCDEVVAYCGDFYGQARNGRPLPEAISVGGLIRTIEKLPPGVTEMACHPGLGNDLDSMYGPERAREVKALCDARVWAALTAAGIELCSFANFPGRAAAPANGERS
jgi:predicted glycoside hydrolase/deacetylase ChbG (UPF0249 family)